MKNKSIAKKCSYSNIYMETVIAVHNVFHIIFFFFEVRDGKE